MRLAERRGSTAVPRTGPSTGITVLPPVCLLPTSQNPGEAGGAPAVLGPVRYYPYWGQYGLFERPEGEPPLYWPQYGYYPYWPQYSPVAGCPAG
jgi:hypothetical protein